MRELHVVAISEDGRHVVLAPTKSGKGSHRVRLDARLVSAVKGELGASDANDLSPKEIQARLRAGESAEQIARTAGVAVTRVERFAGPVAGERMRMIEQAREAFVVRGRLGRSAQPMGKVVDATLDDHAKPDSTAWTARREDDGRWCVQVTWDARGKSRSASWRYDPHDRSLEAADPASAALGHVGDDTGTRRTARKHVSAEPAASAPARQSSPRPAAKAAPAKKAAARTAPVKKAAAKKATTKPAAKQAAPAKKAAAKKALVRKAAAKKAAPAKKAAAKKAAPAKRTAAKKAVPARTTGKKVTAAPRPVVKKAAKAARPRLQVVPDPPAPARAAREAEDRDGVRSRASVPAWADVLLGTTPSNDQ